MKKHFHCIIEDFYCPFNVQLDYTSNSLILNGKFGDPVNTRIEHKACSAKVHCLWKTKELPHNVFTPLPPSISAVWTWHVSRGQWAVFTVTHSRLTLSLSQTVSWFTVQLHHSPIITQRISDLPSVYTVNICGTGSALVSKHIKLWRNVTMLVISGNYWGNP